MSDDIASKVREAFGKFPKRRYPKGQILLFADEDPEHVFYLVDGQVRQHDVSYRGDEIIVNVFKPGAFFPMSCAVNNTPNKYFYKAETEVEVHVVPAAAAMEFIRANPDVMLDLLSRLYRGMDGLLGRLVHLMAGTARSRLAYELLIEAKRFGKTDDAGECALTINETDLAARAGLSRETVSREIGKLKRRNLVKILDGEIRIVDMAGLEKSSTDI